MQEVVITCDNGAHSPPPNFDLALIGHQSTLAILFFESLGDEAMGPRPEQQATPSGDADRRKDHRHEVSWWGQMEVGADRFACSVSDLSQSGAKVRVAQPIIAKEPVRLGAAIRGIRGRGRLDQRWRCRYPICRWGTSPRRQAHRQQAE
jgi:hypothetical protein